MTHEEIYVTFAGTGFLSLPIARRQKHAGGRGTVASVWFPTCLVFFRGERTSAQRRQLTVTLTLDATTVRNESSSPLFGSSQPAACVLRPGSVSRGGSLGPDGDAALPLRCVGRRKGSQRDLSPSGIGRGTHLWGSTRYCTPQYCFRYSLTERYCRSGTNLLLHH